MSSWSLKIDVQGFDERSERAFRLTAFELSREFTRVITVPRYWDATGDNRDIVDNGTLRSSQMLVFTGPMTALYAWPVNYAAPVALGYTKRNGQIVEGRDWTKVAVSEFDTQQAYIDNYRALGG